ncbi:hypothetical protein UFOVP1169_11 [uncultured Caudovirales phage]|uniref:Uncharacterized protein n=1 Tax=uncultured Caudovirales phage TaxID=2100421 RepID=A0A6J5QTA6_9CAUD|nr:hypothetical protein UFOVP1169_11 [uncultured Caudovirales phage]
MATNFVQLGDLLGCNLEGNEAPSTGVDGTTTVPRLLPLSITFISGGRVAIYVQTKASMNPGTTVSLDRSSADGGGTVASTSGTGQYISLNVTAASSGDWIWARTITGIGG